MKQAITKHDLHRAVKKDQIKLLTNIANMLANYQWDYRTSKKFDDAVSVIQASLLDLGHPGWRKRVRAFARKPVGKPRTH